MSFTDFQNQVSAARKGGETKRLVLKEAKRQADRLKRKKEQLLREITIADRDSDERLQELAHAEKKLFQAIASGKSNYADALTGEWATLNEYLQFTNPVENIASLPDDCPILLLPLRLETRFKKIARENGTVDQLWVRVFPDDISINSFESDLSDTEIRNAQSYWLARWSAGKDVAGNRGAWRALAAAHGAGRAYWLISNDNYVPLNLSAEPEKATGEIILAIGTEQALLDPELGAIVAYWQAVWQADKDNALLAQAWNDLLGVVSEARATELVKAYRPANIKEPPPPGLTRGETVARVEFVIFKPADVLETKLHAWSQPPTTSMLPERFVFLAFHNDAPDMPPQLGNLVPPRLILGPDPGAEQGEDFRLATAEDVAADPTIREGDLIFAENMRWMFDFDEAVAKGMGFKVDLTPEQAGRGFDRVFVLGIKLSADKQGGQALLEELFAQHQNSRKGLAIIKQGTPTNNTENDDSGYSWRQDPDVSFDMYFGDGANQPDPGDWYNRRDGRWLADMLGIDPVKLHTLENYYSTDICEAKAMQQALWPATLGHFMESMMNPVFSAQAIEQTRQFFTRYVSGRGNLPAIRVGKQPYGLLPACNYTHMQWFRLRARSNALFRAAAMFQPGNSFLTMLYQILLDIDQVWAQQLDKVAHVGKAGDPHQLLLDIIGLHPDSVELYKRYANSVNQLHNIYNIEGFPHIGLFSFYPTSYISAAALLARYGYSINAEHPEPDIFKKAFFGKSYFLGGDRIDTAPTSEVNLLSLSTTDQKNYINWLIEAAETSHDRLRKQEGFIDDKPPTSLLYLLLYHALDLSYIDASLKLHLSKAVMTASQVQQAYIEPDFIHIEANRETESRWKYLYKTDSRITANTSIRLEQFIAQHIDTLDEAAAFRDVLAGMRKLENVPTARLERAMMEHIDAVSYRHDSWILGFLHLQLEQMRNLQDDAAESQPRRGIYLGAYGWLEDLRPENKVLTPVKLPAELTAIFNPEGDLVEDLSNAGYILTPSQNHAVTAAILRNGHLSNEDPENREELKIKLSSQRVRQALQVIEGIQGGQSLAALLGYQFERGLHDRTDEEVDAFIFDLRNAFPLVAKKFKDTAPGAADAEYTSVTQIEAKNVLDGMAFLEHIEKTGNRSYPFGLTLPPASGTQATAIDQEVLKLIEVNDAVADLALAESVHQVVLGNYERAAATLDTYSKGNFPPTPDVIQTPRSGIQLTHRVALQFKTDRSFTLGDSGVTPRMVAEPAMHDWLNQIMPAMAAIVCVVSFVNRLNDLDEEHEISLQDIGLASIDLLYLLNVESDQAASALDDLIVQHVLTSYTPRLDQAIVIAYTHKLDTSKISVFEITSLIASLRALLLKSRPLTAADTKLANEAAKQDEQTLSLDATRLQPIVAALSDLRTNELANYLTNLKAIISLDSVDAIVNELDNLTDDAAQIFIQASGYGMPQTGIGFVYQWQQGIYRQLHDKLTELIARWQTRRTEYTSLRDEYTAGVGSLSDEELFLLLQQAELKIASTLTSPRPASPAAYFTLIDGTRFAQFNDLLENTIKPIPIIHGLTPLLQSIRSVIGQLPPFDTVGIDISDQLQQIKIFADDLCIGAENLSQEMKNRQTRAADLLASVPVTADALARVELLKNAAKAIFGDDFVIVPQFTVSTTQGTEWQNTLDDSDHSLRYLRNELDLDFPMDNWLYGVSRVREKIYHLENILFHIEGFTDASLELVPTQFPYRPDDFWLGLQYPDKKPGTEEPFTIDEDKLLFTSIYTVAFVADQPQCGLILDEWTEVIPTREETLGLTFHYDQPNSEPPQTLLLVTPSEFTGHWRWDDLVNTLHETLAMAKKRAVEPEHADVTVYNRFLPPIVSLASPLPLTATLNLALNNQVFYAKVFGNE
jgi:hypothetical protein